MTAADHLTALDALHHARTLLERLAFEVGLAAQAGALDLADEAFVIDHLAGRIHDRAAGVELEVLKAREPEQRPFDWDDPPFAIVDNDEGRDLRRCTAHRADGEPCRATAMRHSERRVCRAHASADEVERARALAGRG